MALLYLQLLIPESGYKRYDNINTNIIYKGAWSNLNDPEEYNGTVVYSYELNASYSFNFTGTKLRIISPLNSVHSSDILVTIDGVKYAFSEYSASIQKATLVFEKIGLTNTEHAVTVTNNQSGFALLLDAVDIDDTGELKPYSPVETGHTLLRIIMNDSSEREYRLSSTEINAFIKWYDRTVCTDNTCYTFDDIIDGSKEYLAFEKIISFKVMPLAK